MDKIFGLKLTDPLVLIGGAVALYLLFVDSGPLGDVSSWAAEADDPTMATHQRPPRPGPPPPPQTPPGGPPRPGGGGHPGGHPGGGWGGGHPGGPGGGQGHPGGPPSGHPGPWPRPGPRPNPDWRIHRPQPRPNYRPFRWPSFGFHVPRLPWLGLPDTNISYEQCVWAGQIQGKDISECCQDAGPNVSLFEVENCVYCNERNCS
jgi:hypothetical protein